MLIEVEQTIITGLRSAELNKLIAEQEQERQRVEREIAEQRHKEEMFSELPTIIAKLMNKINDEAEAGNTRFEYVWVESARVGLCGIGYKRFAEHFDNIEPMLKELGYNVYFSFYSDSWRKKSGKICHLSIYW
jgi:hypothetical protein